MLKAATKTLPPVCNWRSQQQHTKAGEEYKAMLVLQGDVKTQSTPVVQQPQLYTQTPEGMHKANLIPQ